MRPRRSVSAASFAAAMVFAAMSPRAGLAGPPPQSCAVTPKSPLVVNVKDKGAKGNGKADDTAAIQAAIDEATVPGGTVLVPDGVYMIDATAKPALSLKDNVILQLGAGATLKAIPNDQKKYAVLTVSGVNDVAVVSGMIEGERDQHKGKGAGAGMGIKIGHGAKRVVISGVTAKKMWADGFYVDHASDVALCGVTADNNRRQGLSVIDVDGLLVLNSVFQNTHGSRPGAGIDFEPDHPDDSIMNVRIENSKFIANEGPGILIAGKKGTVEKIELTRNMFKGNRPMLVEDAPEVLASSICNNRQVGSEEAPSGGLNAYSDPINVVMHQNDCEAGADTRFEVTRFKKKKPN